VGTASESRQADGTRGKVQRRRRRVDVDVVAALGEGRSRTSKRTANPESSCCGVGCVNAGPNNTTIISQFPRSRSAAFALQMLDTQSIFLSSRNMELHTRGEDRRAEA
jgi:hypothetical protein